MIDAPSFDFNSENNDKIELTKDNRESIMNYVNNLI